MTGPGDSSPEAQNAESLALLLDGPSGVLRIGRFSDGPEAGRVVFLREALGVAPSKLVPALTWARSTAHPKLVKVLGFASSDRHLCIASEFIAGASLFQVARATRHRQPLDPSVSLKIVHDALTAALAARRLLDASALRLPVVRTLFADTIWVAEFGETLLTEVAIAPMLHRTEQRQSRSRNSGDPDVAAAGAVLHGLFSDTEGKLSIPAPFLEVVSHILERSYTPSTHRFRSVAEMVNALETLPEGCLATEGEVGCQIRELMRPELDYQRSLLSLHALDDRAETTDGEDDTQVFSPEELLKSSTRPTERPPSSSPTDTSVAIPRLPPPVATSVDETDTSLLFVKSPPAPEIRMSAVASSSLAIAADYGETQIFVPVFARAAGSGSKGSLTPVASMPVYKTDAHSGLPARGEVPGRSAVTPSRLKWWLIAALLALTGMVGVLSARLI